MKEIVFTLYLMIFSYGIINCQSNLFEYSNSVFYRGDAIVFTENYLPTMQLPPNVKIFTPSIEQLNKAEFILMENYNKDLEYTGWKKEKNVRRKYWKYNRQYLGYKNEHGDNHIIINLLNFKCKKKAEDRFDGWKDFFVVGFGEFYEENSIRFVVNIDSSKLRLL